MMLVVNYRSRLQCFTIGKLDSFPPLSLLLQVASARGRTIENDEVAFALHLHAQRQRPRDYTSDSGSGSSSSSSGGGVDDDPFQFDLSRFQKNYHPVKHRSCSGVIEY